MAVFNEKWGMSLVVYSLERVSELLSVWRITWIQSQISSTESALPP